MGKKSPQLAKVAELKFRPLKKNLRHSFTQLRYAVDSGKMPSKRSVNQFIDQVNLMVSYPGFGDEFYTSFKAACTELRTFHNAVDLNSFEKQLACIHSLKKQCHNRFR